MPRYSVIMNWNDNDSEEGTYGWSGIAADEADAERLTREAMAGDDQFADDEDDDPREFGSVVEITTGAVWKAQELEDALRALIPHATAGEALAAAEKLLADLDRA